jgi:hypothetical protein
MLFYDTKKKTYKQNIKICCKYFKMSRFEIFFLVFISLYVLSFQNQSNLYYLSPFFYFSINRLSYFFSQFRFKF